LLRLLFAFVVLGLVSSVLSQEIGWEGRLWNDVLCVLNSVGLACQWRSEYERPVRVLMLL